MSKFNRYFILWFRLYFACHLLYSSLRYFTLFEPQPVVPGLGGSFVAVLSDMGLFTFVKATEGVVGLALLLNLFVPLALVVELPISINIFYLNFVIVGTPRQLFSGPQELLLNLLLMAAYWKDYAHLLHPRTQPGPLWSRQAHRQES